MAVDNTHDTQTTHRAHTLPKLNEPEAFDDVAGGPDGKNSPTVAGRLRMSCAGWKTVPTAEEFYRAVHEPTGRDRETAILLTWYHEAEPMEKVKARLEGAYSWRELVRALHRVGLTRGEGARQINRFARR